MIDYQEQAETLRRRCAKLQTRVEEAEAQAADALTQAEQTLADNRVLLPLAVNYQFLRDSKDSVLVVEDEVGNRYSGDDLDRAVEKNMALALRLRNPRVLS